MKTTLEIQQQSGSESDAPPCSGMLALEDYVFLAPDDDKRKVLRDQWSEATECGSVHCTCGLQRALPLAFRCLYCGQWYCGRCAEQHFGQTINEWIIAKRVAKRREIEARINGQNSQADGSQDPV